MHRAREQGALRADPEPPEKRGTVDDAQEVEGVDESPKKMGRHPTAGQGKAQLVQPVVGFASVGQFPVAYKRAGPRLALAHMLTPTTMSPAAGSADVEVELKTEEDVRVCA